MAKLVNEKVEIFGTSRAELNGQTGVVIVYLETTGRANVKLDRDGSVVALKPANLRPPSYFNTLKGMFDTNELRQNWRALQARAEPLRARVEDALPPAAKPAARSPLSLVALVVLVFALLARGGGGARGARGRGFSSELEDLYDLGYADGRAKRPFGTSRPGFKTKAEASADGNALLEETLRDSPQETRGVREEWEKQTGVGRREDTRSPMV